MTMNKDIELEGQPPIPTHPADPALKGDAGKVTGDDDVLQTPDYNAPPSPGSIKSTGRAADPDVGGSLGEPPISRKSNASDASAEVNDDAELGESQGSESEPRT